VLPLGWHPVNRNAVIVYDLAADPAALTDMAPEQVRERLYTRTEDLPEGQVRPGLKLVHINKCPVLADTKVLLPADIERLQLDMPLLLARAEQLAHWREQGQGTLAEIYREQPGADSAEQDAEVQLYDGFLSDADRRLMTAIREADGAALGAMRWPLRDQRLVDMLPRYRARNFPDSLNAEERQQWLAWCAARLSGAAPGAPVTLPVFLQEIDVLLPTLDAAQQALLASWRAYGLEQAALLGIATA